MPWRREEVAPYCYEDRYIPDTHEKIYYSWVERTPQERDELYHRMNNIPYDAPEEREPDNSWSAARPYDSDQPPAAPKKAEPKDDGKIHLMKPLQLQHKEAADKPKKASQPRKKAGGHGPRH